jgi:hypothetical protein
MRTTIVPAQITTVEDKVAGNLSLTQLLLLSAPVFASAAIYIALPPIMNLSPYKLVLMTLTVIAFGLMAIRIKGKILLLWAITIGRYNLRPRYHILNKNDMHLRIAETVQEALNEVAPTTTAEREQPSPAPTLNPAEVVFLEEIMANPKANLHFKTGKKGGLSVRITEVK